MIWEYKLVKLLLCTSLLLLVGCAASGRDGQHSNHADPEAAFGALEARLLGAERVRLDFHVTAEGAIEIDLHGALAIDRADRAQLTATGHFAGERVEVRLHAQDGAMELANGARQSVAERPADLDAAILIGFTRLGILHNLARLTGTMAPDHADGGVREWVTVGPFEEPGAAGEVSFEITVAGQSAGSASLGLDSTGHPAVRRQTVRFTSGEMRVVERYAAVEIRR